MMKLIILIFLFFVSSIAEVSAVDLSHGMSNNIEWCGPCGSYINTLTGEKVSGPVINSNTKVQNEAGPSDLAQ